MVEGLSKKIENLKYPDWFKMLFPAWSKTQHLGAHIDSTVKENTSGHNTENSHKLFAELKKTFYFKTIFFLFLVFVHV